MKVVIHQPQYFPYPGFFQKLSKADIFVILDNTQYDKRFTNRNQILATKGPIWMSVPINKNHKFALNKEVEINNEMPWRKQHWDKIKFSYSNSKFFKKYSKDFQEIFEKKWELLFELDFVTMKKTLDWLNLDIKILKESELDVKGKSTERLVNICKAVEADTYISGKGLPGKKYIDEELFQKNKIKLEYNEYKSKEYSQNFTNSFVPNLSIIDMIFNVGPKSLMLIKNNDENN
jgi:hypothetical protein